MLEVFVAYKDNRATLSFTAEGEQKTCFFECTHKDHSAPVVYDFAAFACVAIAHKFKTSIVLHAPVTQLALDNCRALSEFNRTAFGRRKAFEVTSETIVVAPKPTGCFASHCISTGVDSTYALLEGVKGVTFTHGLVVHGADYRLEHVSGFDGLYARVVAFCEKAGLDPVVVKTDLRSIGFGWGMHHIAQLAACMHFLGPNFSDVAFAADNTISQDMKRFPWGNNYFIGTHTSGGQTKAHYLGYDVDRYAKIKAIQRDARYLNHLGVCFMDKKSGGNCGACPKCILTRVSFECAGDTCPAIFQAKPDLADFIDTIKINPDKNQARGTAVRSNELIPHVTDPLVRAALIRFHGRAVRRMNQASLPKTEVPIS